MQPEHSVAKMRPKVFYRLDYCQELLPGGVVILLCSAKRPDVGEPSKDELLVELQNN